MTDYNAPLNRLERLITDYLPPRAQWWLGCKHEQVRYFASRWLNVQFVRGYIAGKMGW